MEFENTDSFIKKDGYKEYELDYITRTNAKDGKKYYKFDSSLVNINKLKSEIVVRSGIGCIEQFFNFSMLLRSNLS